MRGRIGAVVLAGFLVCGRIWGVPVLTLDPQTVDWGRQAENKGVYPFAFTVRNTGDELLRITQVRATCSCTKVDLSKRDLAPGESCQMTGTLTVRGLEGALHKSINLTTNDPFHPTVSAGLAIRFPFNGRGVRIKGTAAAVSWRTGALWAYIVVENCEPGTPALIEAMELPAGWDCAQKLPVKLPPEDRTTIVLTRKVPVQAEAQAFDALPYTLVTDSARTPRLQGTLSYHPETSVPVPVAAPAPTPVAPAPAATTKPAEP